MALRLCVLASGSSGNCTYVGSESTGILIDAGLSGRETIRRLGEIGVSVESIQAVCVTHEHSDHTSGLAVLQRGGRVVLYANSGTIDGLKARGVGETLPWQVFSTGSPFQVGDLTLEPFSVPHDAYDPVGFVVSCGSERVGVVTDMGTVTGLIRERLRRCQVIVVEANHDERLLKDADRPWRLKQRIFGRQGHLSNTHAAELIAEVAGDSLAVAYLAHLSRDCNRPDLALKAVTEVLARCGLNRVSIRIASPDRVSEVWISG
jgi:phosphoribosyl 1,2-cyclic phosphodiesterase